MVSVIENINDQDKPDQQESTNSSPDWQDQA